MIFDQFFGSEVVTCAIYFHKMHWAEMVSFCIPHPYSQKCYFDNREKGLIIHAFYPTWSNYWKKMICIMKALKWHIHIKLICSIKNKKFNLINFGNSHRGHTDIQGGGFKSAISITPSQLVSTKFYWRTPPTMVVGRGLGFWLLTWGWV